MKMKKGDIIKINTGRINLLSARDKTGIVVGVYYGDELLSKAMQIALYLEEPRKLSEGEFVRVMWSSGRFSDMLSSFLKKI